MLQSLWDRWLNYAPIMLSVILLMWALVRERKVPLMEKYFTLSLSTGLLVLVIGLVNVTHISMPLEEVYLARGWPVVWFGYAGSGQMLIIIINIVSIALVTFLGLGFARILKRFTHPSWVTTVMNPIILGVITLSPLWAKFTTPPAEFLMLPDISQLQLLNIQDNWAGLSPKYSTQIKYVVQNKIDAFRGTADFAVRDLTAYRPITIPTDVVETFLATLAQTPLESDEYEPTFIWTDDYPTIKIELIYGDRVIEFYTRSQGKDHIPWKITSQGKSYVSYSSSPMRAYSILWPYLERNLPGELQDKSTFE